MFREAVQYLMWQEASDWALPWFNTIDLGCVYPPNLKTVLENSLITNNHFSQKKKYCENKQTPLKSIKEPKMVRPQIFSYKIKYGRVPLV